MSHMRFRVPACQGSVVSPSRAAHHVCEYRVAPFVSVGFSSSDEQTDDDSNAAPEEVAYDAVRGYAVSGAEAGGCRHSS
eukprot:1151309-Prymnesium_polylepis.1